jgi:hypothetical protein
MQLIHPQAMHPSATPCHSPIFCRPHLSPPPPPTPAPPHPLQPAYSSVARGADATRPIPPIPLCTEDLFVRRGAPCLTLAYAPAGAALVEAVVAGVRAHNQPPIPAEQVKGFAGLRGWVGGHGWWVGAWVGAWVGVGWVVGEGGSRGEGSPLLFS